MNTFLGIIFLQGVQSNNLVLQQFLSNIALSYVFIIETGWFSELQYWQSLIFLREYNAFGRCPMYFRNDLYFYRHSIDPYRLFGPIIVDKIIKQQAIKKFLRIYPWMGRQYYLTVILLGWRFGNFLIALFPLSIF